MSGGISIPANANLDDYTTPGSYYCSSHANAITVIGNPSDTAFCMKVEYPLGYSYVSQTVRQYSNGTMWYRLKTGNTWSVWIKYLTNNDLRLKLYIVPKPFENNSIFTSLESWGVYIYKSGKVVMLRLNIYGNMLANNENNVLFTLPTEYISIVDIVVNYVTQKGTTMLLGISKTGEFYLNNIGKTVNDDWICRQQVTYVTDN